MNWHHGIPNSGLVFLLLLSFSTSSEPSKGCTFEHVPIETGNFSKIVGLLKQYLLLDYQVSVPVNLKQDEFCLELWKIHLINKNFKSMISVSGIILKEMITDIVKHTRFVEQCDIDDSCVHFTMTNISEFLEPIPFLLTDLSNTVEKIIESETADFRNCTVIHCQADVPPTPAPRITAPEQKRNEHASPGKLYWGLLAIPVLLFIAIWMLVCRKQCQRSQRYEEAELAPMEDL